MPRNLATTEVSHELEIEFLDADKLLRERRRHMSGHATNYLGVITTFLNNINMLAKKSI